jgi:hypothetical protein
MTGAAGALRMLVMAPELDAELLAGAVRQVTNRTATVEVDRAPAVRARDLVATLARRDDLATHEVVVLSVRSGLADREDGRVDPRAYIDAVTAAADLVKATDGCLLLVNGSSVVPGPRDDERRAVSLDIARLNLAALRLSMATGLSVIDVDRIIAELGGDDHVTGVLEYAAAARAAIAEEAAYVLEDYGFFDDRPVLDQIGQGARR